MWHEDSSLRRSPHLGDITGPVMSPAQLQRQLRWALLHGERRREDSSSSWGGEVVEWGESPPRGGDWGQRRAETGETRPAPGRGLPGLRPLCQAKAQRCGRRGTPRLEARGSRLEAVEDRVPGGQLPCTSHWTAGSWGGGGGSVVLNCYMPRSPRSLPRPGGPPSPSSPPARAGGGPRWSGRSPVRQQSVTPPPPVSISPPPLPPPRPLLGSAPLHVPIFF